MLHPHETERGINPRGIQESCLLDFDLSGKNNEDMYPSTYSTTIPERIGSRAGGPDETMMFEHDWKDLAGTMALYIPVDGAHLHVYGDFVKELREGVAKPVQLFEAFITKHSDLCIGLLEAAETEIYSDIIGTGSPEKGNQKKRLSHSTEKKSDGGN